VDATDRHMASGPTIGSDQDGVDRATNAPRAAFIVVA
jgi:hypothetical protein